MCKLAVLTSRATFLRSRIAETKSEQVRNHSILNIKNRFIFHCWERSRKVKGPIGFNRQVNHSLEVTSLQEGVQVCKPRSPHTLCGDVDHLGRRNVNELLVFVSPGERKAKRNAMILNCL